MERGEAERRYIDQINKPLKIINFIYTNQLLSMKLKHETSIDKKMKNVGCFILLGLFCLIWLAMCGPFPKMHTKYNYLPTVHEARFDLNTIGLHTEHGYFLADLTSPLQDGEFPPHHKTKSITSHVFFQSSEETFRSLPHRIFNSDFEVPENRYFHDTSHLDSRILKNKNWYLEQNKLVREKYDKKKAEYLQYEIARFPSDDSLPQIVRIKQIHPYARNNAINYLVNIPEIESPLRIILMPYEELKYSEFGIGNLIDPLEGVH